MAEGFDYAIAQGHYIDAGNAARRSGQPGYAHQDGLAAVFEAGRQSVLQGGVVVPREALTILAAALLAFGDSPTPAARTMSTRQRRLICTPLHRICLPVRRTFEETIGNLNLGRPNSSIRPKA